MILKIKTPTGPDIELEGHEVGRVSSREGSADRWTELALYQSRSGKYVCECLGASSVPGEKMFREVETCDRLDQVFDFFGGGWLAKELYADAGLEFVSRVG